MLKIYGPAKTRASRVIWLAEELGIPYELKPVNMLEGEHLREPYASLNPKRKIPVIEDGDFVLTESGAILNYLADKYPEKGLIPKAGTRERALHDQWMFFALNDLEPPLWAYFRQTLFLPEEKRSKDLHKEATRNFEKSVKVVSEQLKGRDYLLGDKFGAVDILMASVLGWGKFAAMPGFDDVLEGYLKRTAERPGYRALLKHF